MNRRQQKIILTCSLLLFPVLAHSEIDVQDTLLPVATGATVVNHLTIEKYRSIQRAKMADADKTQGVLENAAAEKEASVARAQAQLTHSARRVVELEAEIQKLRPVVNELQAKREALLAVPESQRDILWRRQYGETNNAHQIQSHDLRRLEEAKIRSERTVAHFSKLLPESKRLAAAYAVPQSIRNAFDDVRLKAWENLASANGWRRVNGYAASLGGSLLLLGAANTVQQSRDLAGLMTERKPAQYAKRAPAGWADTAPKAEQASDVNSDVNIAKVFTAIQLVHPAVEGEAAHAAAQLEFQDPTKPSTKEPEQN